MDKTASMEPPTKKPKSEEETHMCMTCKSTFTDRKVFLEHCNKEHFVACEQCDEVFIFRRELKKHMVLKHGARHVSQSEEETHMCMTCKSTFTDRKVFLEHCNKEHFVACEQCDKVFEFRRQLEKHMVLKHGAAAKHVCETCKMVFSHRDMLIKHTKEVHSLVCDKCTKVFTCKNTYEKHILLEHASGERLVCQTCQSVFSDKNVFLEHTAKDHSYGCKQCNKVFAYQQALEKHIRVKHSLGFVCKMCGAKFKTEVFYKHHVTTHGETATHKCKWCKRRFPNKARLAAHQKTQDGEQLSCPICYRTFESKFLLADHISSHSDLCAFKCSACSTTFKTKPCLNLHMKTCEVLREDKNADITNSEKHLVTAPEVSDQNPGNLSKNVINDNKKQKTTQSKSIASHTGSANQLQNEIENIQSRVDGSISQLTLSTKGYFEVVVEPDPQRTEDMADDNDSIGQSSPDCHTMEDLSGRETVDNVAIQDDAESLVPEYMTVEKTNAKKKTRRIKFLSEKLEELKKANEALETTASAVGVLKTNEQITEPKISQVGKASDKITLSGPPAKMSVLIPGMVKVNRKRQGTPPSTKTSQVQGQASIDEAGLEVHSENQRKSEQKEAEVEELDHYSVALQGVGQEFVEQESKTRHMDGAANTSDLDRPEEQVERASSPPLSGPLFACSECNEEFLTLNELMVHEETHWDPLPSALSSLPSMLTAVPQTSTMRSMDQSKESSTVYKESGSKKVNKKHDSAETPLVVLKVPASTESRPSELVQKYDKERLTCNYCNQVYLGVQNMKKHLTSCTKLKINEKMKKKAVEMVQETKTTTIVNHLTAKGSMKSDTSPVTDREQAATVSLKRSSNSATVTRQTTTLSTNHQVTTESKITANVTDVVQRNCGICQMSFLSKLGLSNHLLEEHHQNSCVCDECGLPCRNELTLNRHILETHADTSKYVCSLCDIIFSTWMELEMHRSTHTGEPVASCPVGENTKKKTTTEKLEEPTPKITVKQLTAIVTRKDQKAVVTLKQPTATVTATQQTGTVTTKGNITEKETEVVIQNCSICQKSFLNKLDLSNHIIYDHKPESFRCIVCGLELKTEMSLDIHKLHIHGDTTKYWCDVCVVSFTTKKDLEIHKASPSHTVEVFPTCTICNVLFTEQKFLDLHMTSHPDVEEYPCEYCDKTFQTKRRQYMHVKRCHRPNPNFACHICGKCCLDSWKLQKHIQTHGGPKAKKIQAKAAREEVKRIAKEKGERTMKCEDCDLTFKSEKCLNRHDLVVHSEANLHFCDECDESFPTKVKLEIHKSTHTGEELPSCPVCSQVFTENCFLDDHMRIHHSDIDEFPCGHCDKSFRTKRRRYMHVKRCHDTDRKYACHICERSFIDAWKLRKHISTHENPLAKKLKCVMEARAKNESSGEESPRKQAVLRDNGMVKVFKVPHKGLAQLEPFLKEQVVMEGNMSEHVSEDAIVEQQDVQDSASGVSD